MATISSITCNRFLDSRGNWTIHTKVVLDDGSVGMQSIPEGASKGKHEAVSVPVDKAMRYVSGPFNMALAGKSPLNQQEIDTVLINLDGTPNKQKLGGNSILSVSLAVAKAAAAHTKAPLYKYLKDLYGNTEQIKFPTPVFNVLNGGKHAHNNLSFQEFMVIPAQYTPYDQALEMGVTIYHQLQKGLEESGLDVDVGDEGGFAPNGLTVKKALTLIKDATKKGYKVGRDVFLGLDVAAGSFYKNGKYAIPEEKLQLSGRDLANYYVELVKEFELIYLEDPFYEEDFDSWQDFFSSFSTKFLIVADDLVVTNTRLLREAITKKRANAVIVKPNQIGTLTETFEFVRTAQNADMSVVVSHRSGDTPEDTFIADLAVAVGANFIKAGAPARGERVAKYNRLLEIFYDHETSS